MNPELIRRGLKALQMIISAKNSTDENGGANTILMVLAVPLILIFLIFCIIPSALFIDKQDGFNIDRTDYENVSEALNIPFKQLVIFDTVKYENNLENVSSIDVIKSGFELVDITINEYEKTQVTYDERPEDYDFWYDEDNNTWYVRTEYVFKEKKVINTLSDYEKYYGKVVSVADIKNKFEELLADPDRFKVSYNVISFESMISKYDEESKNYAIELFNADIYESAELTFNIYDGNIDFNSLVEYDKNLGNGIVYFSQTDKRWATSSYGRSTILSGGCGPTSLSMVVAEYKDSNITPVDVTNWSYANGHRAEGQGSYWSLIREGGKYYGFNVLTLNKTNKSEVIKQLNKGYPIIAAMGPGHFTRTGHFIVLTGIENNKILVNDPSSVKRTQTSWDIDMLLSECSRKDGGNSLWVLIP